MLGLTLHDVSPPPPLALSREGDPLPLHFQARERTDIPPTSPCTSNSGCRFPPLSRWSAPVRPLPLSLRFQQGFRTPKRPSHNHPRRNSKGKPDHSFNFKDELPFLASPRGEASRPNSPPSLVPDWTDAKHRTDAERREDTPPLNHKTPKSLGPSIPKPLNPLSPQTPQPQNP